MPVPDTYSRRSVREESYTFSTRSSRPSSYLSNYTSKYSSTLPPRPPLYERKISELNTSSTTGSRFLNGSGSTRAGTTYGSSYVRSSVSPVRATSSLRRNLEGTSTTTSSITDRLRALELSGEKEPIYKFTRNKDRDSSSSSLGGSTTATKNYGTYGRDRDRSGSRELGSSPLISSSMTLGSRDRVSDLKSDRDTTRSRSSSTTTLAGSPTSTYGRTRDTTTTGSNGVTSRLGTSEVNKSSVVSSSESTSATPTNSVVSKINEGDSVDCRDVENNDDEGSSSAVDSSASPPLFSHNDEVSLHMNGNDTIPDKDLLLSSSESDDNNKKKKEMRVKSDNVHFFESPTLTKDSNGNTININENEDENEKGHSDVQSDNNYTTTNYSFPSRNHNHLFDTHDSNNSTTENSTKQTVPSTKENTNSDSNANLVTVVKINKSALTGGTCGLSSSVTSDRDPSSRKLSGSGGGGEIGVKKSLLKPNNLSSTKGVQTKSKIIIHKFALEDSSPPPSSSPVRSIEVSPEKSLKVSPSSSTTTVNLPENNSRVSIISSRKSPENNCSSDGSTSASFTIVRKKSTGGEKRHSNGTCHTPMTVITTTLNNETDNNDQEKSSSPPTTISTTTSNTQQNLDHVKSKKYGGSSSNSLLANSSSSSDLDRKRESTSPFKDDEELTRVKIAKNQYQVSTSRSPSPATTTFNTNNCKVPTPPPLPELHLLSSSSSKSEEQKNVEPDEIKMAGPHSSKYSSPNRGKTDHQQPDRSADRTRKHTYTSDSSTSDNDSEGYSTSPQVGRFRARDSEKSGLTGLRNIGNTCFMNSVLQCLSNTRPLLDYILQDNYEINSTTSSMKGALIRAFSQVIQELWRETRTVDTSAFKDQIQRFAPRFMGYSQQDAQEFLRYLLEGLHEDVNRVTVKPKPITTDIDDSLSDSQKAAESWKRYLRYDDSKIVDIFVGQLKSTLKCTTCGHCSVTFDPFWDLSLPIPARPNQTKLNNCFELFTREEILDGDEKPTCSKCQCRRKCTKSLSIQKFPKILVVHLKRFSPTERYRGKLSTTVDYPIKGLDLTAFAANPGQSCSYNLYGLSNHSGSTYSGHYVAYCKHPYSGEWHCYNDSRVSSVPSQHIVSSEGYVLFYDRTV